MPQRAIARRVNRLSLRAQTRIVFVIPVLILLALQMGVRHYEDQAREQVEAIQSIEDWRHSTLLLYQGLLSAESAVRGYHLAGAVDQAFLKPYFAALRSVPAVVRDLRAQAVEFPHFAEHLQELETLVDQRLLALTTLRRVPPGAAQELRASQAVAGRLITERVLHELRHLQLEEAHLQNLRQRRLEAANRMKWLVSFAAPVVLGSTFLLVMWLNKRVLRRLEQVARNMVGLVEGDPIEPLEGEVKETRELNAAFERAADLLSRRESEGVAARTEAERANHAKTAFLSRMSHELRTPLTAVLGFAELLDMGELDEDQRDSVRHIRTAGAHLLTLINEVLDISRIESGHLPVSIEPVELGSVLDSALALIRPMAEERGIRLPRSSGEGVFLRADRQRITQVLLNLLSNAVKYNRQFGEIRLDCQVADDRVRLSVSDTGMGIAEELMPRVFAPFDRLGAEQTGVQGTGVGLVLSKGLVEAMAGTLTLESTPGVGTTFHIDLPAATQPQHPDPALGQPGAVGSAEASGSVPREVTVMYVEDNAANLDLVARFVEQLPGVRLIPTMQGQLAVDMARLHCPDVILLDLHLPDLDGESVLRRLSEDPETAGIRVVMLTADATPGQERRLRALGAYDYLTKPLDFPRLAALLRGSAPAVQP